MAGERAGHTLQPTALVNEAYLRLVDLHQVQWQDRAHFFAMSARLMRRILVNVARAKGYQKRGGGATQVSFDEALVVSHERGDDLVALDDALTAFAIVDRPQGPGRGAAVLRRPERGGNRRGAERVAGNRHARLETGEGLAASRARRRRAHA